MVRVRPRPPAVDAQGGLYAAWALLFTLQFTYQSKRAQIDPLVVFFITLANYDLVRHLLLGPNWKMWALGGFAAGLAPSPRASACWRC